jgi:hypothetical protein
MSEQPRNWDRELADIDRAIAKQGNASPAGPPAPLPGGKVPVPAAPVRRRSVALTWFWVGLALALAFALLIWPYQRACGLQLMFYLGAAGVTGVIALLGALASWSHRRGFAHVLSLLVLLWVGAVALREVLPRVGYARTNLTWMCASVPAAPAPAPGGPAPQTTAPGKPAPQATAP